MAASRSRGLLVGVFTSLLLVACADMERPVATSRAKGVTPAASLSPARPKLLNDFLDEAAVRTPVFAGVYYD